jgi:hypothetical protein
VRYIGPESFMDNLGANGTLVLVMAAKAAITKEGAEEAHTAPPLAYCTGQRSTAKEIPRPPWP